MINIITDDKIKIYFDGLLLLDGTSYDNIKSIVCKTINLIQDEYQLSILTKVLDYIEREVA